MLISISFAFACHLAMVQQDLIVGDGTVDGSRLKEGVTTWEIVLNQDQVIGTVKQTIAAKSHEGKDAWWIEIIQDVPGRMHMTDTFLVDRTHLRPFHFHNVRKHEKSVSLVYRGSQVQGRITKFDGTESPISETLMPERFEGNLWGPLLASLPYRQGFSCTIPFFQYDQGKTQLEIKTIGKTHVPGPKGDEVEAWEVEVVTPKGNRMTYYISDTHGELGYRVGSLTQRLVQK